MAKRTVTPTPILENIVYSMNFMYERRNERDGSQPQQSYIRAIQHSTAMLRTLAENGTLEECLNAVDSVLKHDLLFLAKTNEHTKAIQQNIKNFRQARNNLEAMKSRPAEYRRQADGYIDDYKIGGEIPKDGMHGALRAYMGHLKARDSQYLMPEESDFILAQKTLVAEITKRYTQMQRKILKKP